MKPIALMMAFGPVVILASFDNLKSACIAGAVYEIALLSTWLGGKNE